MTGIMCLLLGAGRAQLGVSLNTSSLYTQRTGAGSATSSAAVATAIGGIGPYTYAWSQVTGDAYTINSPTGASTTFTTSLAATTFKTGVYRCTVTDSLGATAQATLTVEFEAL